MTSRSYLSMLPLLLAASAVLPALAIPPDDVANKLDSIIVFAPIDSSSSSSPMPLKIELDGESRSVYFAAFSPAAVQQVINERLIPQNVKDAKNVKFAPYSLSKFDSLVQSELTSNTNARVVYVPDPIQIPFAKKLLIEQGASASDAELITRKMPSVFCPSPSIKATPNSGPLKGQTFTPCSTDYQSVKGMVDKGIATNADLKEGELGVVAIPISRFAAMLVKSSKKDMGDVRVMPNPVNIKAINSLKK